MKPGQKKHSPVYGWVRLLYQRSACSNVWRVAMLQRGAGQPARGEAKESWLGGCHMLTDRDHQGQTWEEATA